MSTVVMADYPVNGTELCSIKYRDRPVLLLWQHAITNKYIVSLYYVEPHRHFEYDTYQKAYQVYRYYEGFARQWVKRQRQREEATKRTEEYKQTYTKRIEEKKKEREEEERRRRQIEEAKLREKDAKMKEYFALLDEKSRQLIEEHKRRLEEEKRRLREEYERRYEELSKRYEELKRRFEEEKKIKEYEEEYKPRPDVDIPKPPPMWDIPGQIWYRLQLFGKWILDRLGDATKIVTNAFTGLFTFIARNAFEKLRESKDEGYGFVKALYKDATKGVSEAFSPTSPDKEIEEAVKELLDKTRQRLEEIVKKAYHSPPDPSAIMSVASEVAATVMTAQATAETIATAADAVHPMRRLGIPDMIRNILNTMGIWALVASIMQSPVSKMLLRPLDYATNKMYPTVIPDPSSLTTMWIQNVLTTDEFIDKMKEHGYDEDWTRKLIEIAKRTLTRFETRIIWEAVGLSDDELDAYLDKAGYKGREKELIKGYVKQFSARTERMTSARWIAEMFARDVVTEDEAKRLMRELNIRDEIVDALLWRGRVYKKVLKARLMYRQRERVAKQIVKGVKKGDITIVEAIDMLKQLGYEEDEAKYLIAIELAESSPETYLEYLDLVMKYRKALGLEAKEIPEDVIRLEKEIKELRKRRDEVCGKDPQSIECASLEADLAMKINEYRKRLEELGLAAR